MLAKLAALFSGGSSAAAAPAAPNVVRVDGAATTADATGGLVRFSAAVALKAQPAVATDKPYDMLFKVLLIGESNAGKSSQIRRFANDTFSNAYCSTIGVDFSVRTLTFGERTVKLQVWDTSGQERFRSITSSYYRGAHAVMIVYAGNDRRSFEGVPRWLEEVDRYCMEGTVRMIVAAKNDLERAVTDAEGREFAARHGCLFASTSAKSGDGVFDSFASLASAVGQLDSAAQFGVDRTVARQADTNVMRINLAKLADTTVALITGDPTRCRGCGVFMSALSTDVVQKQQPAPQQKTAYTCPIEMAPPIHPMFAFADERNGTASAAAAAAAAAQCIWNCEYCGFANAVNTNAAELAELRQAGSVMDYLVRPAPTIELQQHQNGGGNTILFVLDVSGSMCCTSEVPNARAHAFKGRAGLDKDEFAGLLRADEGRHQQHLPRQPRNVAYVSRLALVQAAVAKQINELWLREPDARVGLIAFGDAVHLIGDAMGPEQVVAGDRLHSWDDLNAVDFAVRQPLAASRDALLAKLWALREGGQTALGPALHLAINASSANGTIVLGTDGLANVGLGDLSTASLVDANQFYIELGERCRVKGVTANIVSIEGAECRLQSLETVVQQTRGTLHRINPLALDDIMGALVEQTTVAQTVLTMVCLHRGLHFKGEADDELERRNWLVRDCGTVHAAGDAITVSFGFRSKDAFDFTDTKAVPLQLQLLHTRNDGSQYVRVCSVTLALTADKAAAVLDAAVLNTHVAQRVAKSLQRGERLDALQTLQEASDMLGSNMSPALMGLNDNNATVTDALIAQTSKFCTKM